jgi:hypothetical protein
MTVPAVDMLPSITRTTWAPSTTWATVATSRSPTTNPDPWLAPSQVATSIRTTPLRTRAKADFSVGGWLLGEEATLVLVAGVDGVTVEVVGGPWVTVTVVVPWSAVPAEHAASDASTATGSTTPSPCRMFDPR